MRRIGAHNIVRVPPPDAEELEQRLEQPGHPAAMATGRRSALAKFAIMQVCCQWHIGLISLGEGGGGDFTDANS